MKVVLEGKVNFETFPKYKKEFQGISEDLTLNFEKVVQIDSTGLGLLIALKSSLNRAGKDLTLESLPVEIKKSFKKVGLLEPFGLELS